MTLGTERAKVPAIARKLVQAHFCRLPCFDISHSASASPPLVLPFCLLPLFHCSVQNASLPSDQWLKQNKPRSIIFFRSARIWYFQSELFSGEVFSYSPRQRITWKLFNCVSTLTPTARVLLIYALVFVYLCTLSCCFIPPDMFVFCFVYSVNSDIFVFCFVYSVLLFPPNRETSWNIHFQGSVANGLTNTIQLIPNHFNLTLSIFNKYYWWSLAEDLSLCPMDAWDARSTIPSLCSFKYQWPAWFEMVRLSPFWLKG